MVSLFVGDVGDNSQHSIYPELPSDPKVATFDPFQCYPQVELQNLPTDMPAEYRQTIRSLLPFVSPNLAVADLVYTSKDSNGTESLLPVQNRPWEWTEYLGEPAELDVKDDHPIKNSASLSLELFAARATGERVLQASSMNPDDRVDANLRALQDENLGESIFKRDWRETRIVPERALSGPAQDEHFSSGTSAPPTRVASDGRPSSSQSSRMASPVSSVRSRGSVQPTSTHNPSPGSFARFGGSSVADPIDVDNLDSSVSAVTTQGKRKLSEIAENDEIEVVEGMSSQSKRLKGKAAAKARVKKR